jgi:hypothetical protein
MKKYIAALDSDPNDYIELDADNPEDAAHEALDQLGWSIKEIVEPDPIDENQFVFQFAQ